VVQLRVRLAFQGRKHLRKLLCISGLAATACGSDQPAASWREAGSPRLEIAVSEHRTTCGGCLQLRERVRIAPSGGPGVVDESHYVARDSSGHVIVVRSSGHQVYDRNGAFLQIIGRAGSGPLEFALAGPMAIDAVGNIHFFDPALNRETVVDRNFRLLRETTLALGVVYDAVAVGDGRTRFVNSVSMDPVKIGHTVHRIDGDSVVASFGEPNDSAYSPASVALQRQLAMHPSGHLVSVRRFEYVIEVFSPGGERRLLARRKGVWPQTAGDPAPVARGTTLNGYVQDVEVDSLGHVWVLSMEPRSDWERYAKDAVLPNGMKVLMPTPDAPPWWRSRLEVLDLDTGRVLASRVFEQQLWGFLGASQLYGYEYTSQGEPQLVIYGASISLPPS
jgi:hypothetical protein